MAKITGYVSEVIIIPKDFGEEPRKYKFSLINTRMELPEFQDPTPRRELSIKGAIITPIMQLDWYFDELVDELYKAYKNGDRVAALALADYVKEKWELENAR